MDNHKVCFIACVNDDEYEYELVKCLNNLIVPETMEIEYLSIRDACSMCAGYNEGMSASDAKYKVYLHQDTFIVNRHFIEDLLSVFEDNSIGMLGLIGSGHLPDDCVMWHGDRVGKVYFSTYYKAGINEQNEVDRHSNCEKVECVDGFLIATQIDIPWREDLFDKWDFYDISQSIEMLHAGYKVVVPYQETPWCIHDDAFMNLSNYNTGRQKFIEEYFPDRDKIETKLHIVDVNEINKKVKEADLLIAIHSKDAYGRLCELLDDESWFIPVRESDEIASLWFAASIYKSQEERGDTDRTIFDLVNSTHEIKALLFKWRMALYEYSFDYYSDMDMFLELWNYYPSMPLLWKCILLMMPEPDKTAPIVKNIFELANMEKESLLMQIFIEYRNNV